MAIDYERTIATFPAGNNISRPDLISNVTNSGSRPFLAGVSRFNDTAIFLALFSGFMSRAVSNTTPTIEGDFAFATPIQFTIFPETGESLKGFIFRFDAIVGQFATRFTINGEPFTNNSPRALINVEDGLPQYVVRITHWNVGGANCRITSVVQDEREIIEVTRIGLNRASLQPCPKFFSSWLTRNILSDMSSPTRVLDATLIRNGDMFYLPEATFEYKFLSPEEHSFMVQILNAPEFVIEYYDQELLRTVIRKMYTAELSTNRPLAFSQVYKGIVGQKFRMVSYYGYDVIYGSNTSYVDLIARAVNDERIT